MNSLREDNCQDIPNGMFSRDCNRLRVLGLPDIISIFSLFTYIPLILRGILVLVLGKLGELDGAAIVEYFH